MTNERRWLLASTILYMMTIVLLNMNSGYTTYPLMTVVNSMWIGVCLVFMVRAIVLYIEYGE